MLARRSRGKAAEKILYRCVIGEGGPDLEHQLVEMGALAMGMLVDQRGELGAPFGDQVGARLEHLHRLRTAAQADGPIIV